jgi:hypothetical protein
VPGKQKIFLLVALLFGLPALVTLGLLTSRTKSELVDGAQPGGVVKGRVARPNGKAGSEVDVIAAKVVGNSIGDELARVRTDAEGAFEIKLPPHEGRYVLRFTGQALQEALVEFGWIARGGKRIEPPELAVEMHAGCRLEIEIVGADKRPAGGGKYELSGSTNAGLLGGFAQGRVSRSGAFEKGAFSVDGLPPMSARLQVRLDSGERVDSVLELVEGTSTHKIEL